MVSEANEAWAKLAPSRFVFLFPNTFINKSQQFFLHLVASVWLFGGCPIIISLTEQKKVG